MKKQIKGTVVVFKLLKDSFIFAFSSIAANKLRTSLSLLGITIGIFSIILVFTAVDALTNSIESGLASLGGNVVYIDRFPWVEEEESGEYQWWKYRQRPPAKYDEYDYIKNNSKYADATSFLVSFSRELKYKSNQTSSLTVQGATHEWENIGTFEVERGRYFTQHESTVGTNSVVIGYKIAEELFGNEDPLSKEMKIGNFKVNVVGVLKREGKSIVSPMDYDNIALVPYNFAKTIINTSTRGGTIAVMAQTGIPNNEIKEELRVLMRKVRRLSPGQEDNFALNELGALAKETEQISGVLNIVGGIIGGFAMLIGAFGIANIMFVSVKERTNIIGIQKALGAKRYFILMQFLYEAVLLAIMGGIFGLILVYGGVLIASNALDFAMSLSFDNIAIGLGISAGVGLIAGFIPAYTASRLDPVVAINSK